ncbi:MAG: 3-hydroxyacyl-CoA dehydrogenase NAD-binding domain-containing protein [Candidatus Promineifilaceae bacterium]
MLTMQQDEQNIVTLTLDMPGRPVNVLNEGLLTAVSHAIDHIAVDEQIKGIILISAKKSWVAGADIDTMFQSRDPQYFFEIAQAMKGILRRLEMLGKPVVAALNGTALGGGFELALACHYRIALDDNRIQFGFPEVGLGLLPGGGGIVRTGRLIGLQAALDWLTQNKKHTPRQTLEAGLIHALANDVDEMLAQAKAWILANPDAKAPWDSVKRYKIPGGGPDHPAILPLLSAAPAMIRQETRGNYPAPIAILSALVEGAQVDFDTACRIESRYFAKVAAGQVSKNMIAALWTQFNQIKKGVSRPQGVLPQQTRKVGVLGAGMMGHGIAYVAARAGLDVVLVDVSLDTAVAGKNKIAAIMETKNSQGRLLQDDMAATLNRILPTADYNQLTGCDLVIEAVFENRDVKAKVTQAAESVMLPEGVFASNTSTLPITSLAKASTRPARFIGMHFFSPVHKMKLVELIVGAQTSDETLAKAFDFVLAIGKIPIVVNDSRGFYTSRVFSTWTNEAMAMLAEGQHPQAVEMAGLQAGMPVGPLAVLDEVSLALFAHIRAQTVADLAAEGKIYRPHPGEVVLDKLLALGRTGRAGGAGFYDYNGRSKHLWPQLTELFMNGQPQLLQQEMIDRLLYIQSIETVRCLEEGVLRSVADANLGSIFGWGFAPCHGGTLQFINACGLDNFIARARLLADRYGERFSPPALLLVMAEKGEQFV